MTAARRTAEAIQAAALALLHPSERARYREEWRADLDGAAEARMSPVPLALGALRFGIGARFAAARRVGLGAEQRSVRLIRWALVPLALAPILALVAFTMGVPALLGRELLLAVTALWLFGVVLLGVALRVGKRSLWWLCLALSPGLVMVSPMSPLLVAPVLTVGAGVGLGLFVAWANRVDGVPEPPSAPLGRRLRAAAVAFALVLVVIALGMLDGLVWMPLTITDDGYRLEEIYSIVGLGVTVPLFVWAVIGLTLGLGVVVVAALPSAATIRVLSPRRIVLLGFVLAGLGLLAAPWGAFSIGMEISDLIPPMAGGRSDVSPFLALAGGLSLVVALLGSLPPGRPQPARAATAD